MGHGHLFPWRPTGNRCRPHPALLSTTAPGNWGKHPKTMETIAILVAKIQGFIRKIWWFMMHSGWIYRWPVGSIPIGPGFIFRSGVLWKFPSHFKEYTQFHKPQVGMVTMALDLNMFKRFTMFTSLIIFNTWLWSDQMGWLSPALMLPKTGTRGPPRSRANWYIAGIASTYTEESTAQ